MRFNPHASICKDKGPPVSRWTYNYFQWQEWVSRDQTDPLSELPAQIKFSISINIKKARKCELYLVAVKYKFAKLSQICHNPYIQASTTF